MASTIQFSQEELRGIRTQCEALLGVMNSRAQEIVRLSEEIEKEINNSVLSSHCPPQENLSGVIGSYRVQLRHLEQAAGLYDRCSEEVYAEAEAAVKKGGTRR